MQEFILNENKKIKEMSLWREPATLNSSRASELVLDGKKYLNFSSNDYLGLSTHPEVVRAAQEAIERYGAGGKSSRLVSGTLDLHRELEERLAKFKKTESALVFPTGFMTNLGVISALLGAGDALIMDRLNHASLIDAAKLAGCRIFVYEHCSTHSLEKVLQRTKNYKKRLVATDSLFSMDGDSAPLDGMVELCRTYKVWLMIDDAHASGIFGKKGGGMAEHFGLLGKIEIVMGTLSKALGSQGGFVCGSKDFIDFLKNRSRPFIYTTALSPGACGAALKSLELVGKEPWRREKLLKLSGKFRKSLREKCPLNSKLIQEQTDVESQIVPFWVGPAEETILLSNRLKESNIFAPAIRPPTVPNNECRLRFSLTSEHREEDLNALFQALGTPE